MKLGTLNLKNNLILAPLQNVTSSPYRNFCRYFYDIGLVCVPMLYTKRLMKSPKSVEQELLKLEEERPISVQLIGSDTEALIKAIEYLESYKFDVLDINAGCPSKRAIKAKEGGYLLKDLKKLEELLNIAIKYSSRPVSLKIRLGFQNADLKAIKDLANVINNTAIDFCTIHARSVISRFDVSTLNLNALKELKDLTSIPLVGNGDITNHEVAKTFLDYTDVDALMIGRGSLGNPEIFLQIHTYLSKGEEIPFKNDSNLMKKRIEIYEQMIDSFLENSTLKYPLEEFKFVELKRNAIWLTKNMDNSTEIRIKLSKTKNLKELKIILKDIFKNYI